MVCFAAPLPPAQPAAPCSAPSDLNANPNNTREILRDFSQPRGSISHRRRRGDRHARWRRTTGSSSSGEYPRGRPVRPLTGYFSFTLGSSGVEKVYNDELGRPDPGPGAPATSPTCSSTRTASATSPSPIRRRPRSGSRPSSSGTAKGSVSRARPAHRRHPRDGLHPDLRPEPAGRPRHPGRRRRRPGGLDADPEKPRLARTYQERFFPGSTFKVVTATARPHGRRRHGRPARRTRSATGTPRPDRPPDPELRRGLLRRHAVR